MVDNGSAVNLLQLLVIQKMGLESTIIRWAEVLIKFNGHTSTAISYITLDVKAPLVGSKQTFTIVSDPSLPTMGFLEDLGWSSWMSSLPSSIKKFWFRIPGGGVERDQVWPGHILTMHCASVERVKEEDLYFRGGCRSPKGRRCYQIAITAVGSRRWRLSRQDRMETRRGCRRHYSWSLVVEKDG